MKQLPRAHARLLSAPSENAGAEQNCCPRAPRRANSAMQRTIAMQNEMGNKKGGAAGIRTWGAAMQAPRTSQLSWLTFSCREQAQPYLLGAKKEN